MRILFIFLFSLSVNAQRADLAVSLIPDALRENANAVVRLHSVDVQITSRNHMLVKTSRAVTIFNEHGLKHIGASEYYNVKSVAATVYDVSGAEIKKIKRKDFKQVAVSEGSLITDNVLTYLDYTPPQYPFTILYESETWTPNTAFIPSWHPVDNFLVSVEKSTVTVTSLPGLGLKYKEYNFTGTQITKVEKPDSVTFTATSLPIVRAEEYSPSFQKITPYVLFGLEKFHLEGVDGEASTWSNMGSWNYHQLIKGTDELPDETINKIRALVGSEQDPMQKAKIVYKYVQDRTRYVSIQLGIGGWRPMKARDVDRLGYGDCKALSNYTRSLLSAVGVPSYYCVVYGDDDKRDLMSDFVSMQGNHAILAIPDGNEMRWLECTSQTAPFNFQANFTDDRMALVVKPEGSQLMRTNVYRFADNTQLSKGAYKISSDGSITGDIEIRTKGFQYDNRQILEKKSAAELNTFYRNYFNQINNLQFNSVAVKNDKSAPEFTESISLAAAGFGNISGNSIIFPVNAFNQMSAVPARYRNRQNPFEISRGFHDIDEITITIPDGHAIDSKPANVHLKEVYGEYKAEFTVIDPTHILYKRSLQINEGIFPAADYENFRKFREAIARNDNAKCLLVKI